MFDDHFDAPANDLHNNIDTSSIKPSLPSPRHRHRGFRRAANARAQNRQRHIARGFYLIAPGADAKPQWRKEKALTCKENCGHCRNPRFNRNSNGQTRLTLAELRNRDHFNYTLAELDPEDFALLPIDQAA